MILFTVLNRITRGKLLAFRLALLALRSSEVLQRGDLCSVFVVLFSDINTVFLSSSKLISLPPVFTAHNWWLLAVQALFSSMTIYGVLGGDCPLGLVTDASCGIERAT